MARMRKSEQLINQPDFILSFKTILQQKQTRFIPVYEFISFSQVLGNAPPVTLTSNSSVLPVAENGNHAFVSNSIMTMLLWPSCCDYLVMTTLQPRLCFRGLLWPNCYAYILVCNLFVYQIPHLETPTPIKAIKALNFPKSNADHLSTPFRERQPVYTNFKEACFN